MMNRAINTIPFTCCEKRYRDPNLQYAVVLVEKRKPEFVWGVDRGVSGIAGVWVLFLAIPCYSLLSRAIP